MQRSMTKLFLALYLTLSLVSTVFAGEQTTDLDNIKNFRQPSENLYTSGQPHAESFTALAKAGVRHVINLRPATETSKFNEAAIATQANMAYYNIPVSGAGDLTRDNVKLLDNLLERAGNEKVLLHCSSGNRAGALMALRAAWMEGVTVEQAIMVGQRHGLTKLQPAVERLLTEQ